MMRACWLVILGALGVALLLVGGCGGHDGQVPPGDDDGGPTAATFVGRDVCAVCHSGVNGAFAKSAHGKDFHDPGSNGAGADLISGMGGACAPCHVTGFGEASGWTSSAQTPQLDNIGCEECHGKGSTHAGNSSVSNITRLPSASTTCWDCHVPSYKLLRSGAPAMVTDASLAGTAPGKVSVHYRETPMLLGYLGYKIDQLQGPHAQIENTCVTCHLNPGSQSKHGASALQPDFNACVGCHGSAAAAEALFESFDEEIIARLIALGGASTSDPSEPDGNAGGGLLAAYATSRSIDLNTNADPNNVAVQRYKAARMNYLYVLNSAAVHNPPFAEKLLDDAEQLLQ